MVLEKVKYPAIYPLVKHPSPDRILDYLEAAGVKALDELEKPVEVTVAATTL